MARAEAQVAALGVFHALLNGEAMGQDFLSPGWVEYSRRIPVLRYDLTGRLKPGANAVGVILGDGWYAGRIAIYGRGLYGGYPLALWLRLTITYADGRIQTLGSDESWLAGTGAILWADLLTGEYRDARLEPAGFGCPGFRAEGWRAPQVLEDRSALLEEARCEPVTLHEKLDAVCLGQVDGRWIYDIGQNMAGILRVRIRGVRGAVLRFRHGEMLREDGSLYTENLRSAQAEDTYICRGGGEEVFQPLFTFHGFRYAEVTIEGEAEILELAGWRPIRICARRGNSPAPPPWSTALPSTRSGDRKATSSASPPTARSGMSGWAGRGTPRFSARAPCTRWTAAAFSASICATSSTRCGRTAR